MAAIITRLRALAATSAPVVARARRRESSTSAVETVWLALSCLVTWKPADCDHPATAPALHAAFLMLWCWSAPLVIVTAIGLALNTMSSLYSTMCWLLAGAAFISCATDWQWRRSLWSPGAVAPGLHYRSSPRNTCIARGLQRPYGRMSGAAPGHPSTLTGWLFSGDHFTLYPFIAFPSPSRPANLYERVWFRAPAWGDAAPERAGAPPRTAARDEEVLALDVALPEGGKHDPSKPIFLVLHGLNGGSAEPYVLDFVLQSRAKGHTCAVLVARGLGGTHIQSGVPFNGARTTDLAQCLELLRAAVAPDATPIVAVGFSMGGIILANYCGKAGADTPLACAIAFSGCYDSVRGTPAHGNRLWTPWLALELKRSFLSTSSGNSDVLRGGAHGGPVDLDAAAGAGVVTIRDFDTASECALEPSRVLVEARDANGGAVHMLESRATWQLSCPFSGTRTSTSTTRPCPSARPSPRPATWPSRCSPCTHATTRSSTRPRTTLQSAAATTTCGSSSRAMAGTLDGPRAPRLAATAGGICARSLGSLARRASRRTTSVSRRTRRRCRWPAPRHGGVRFPLPSADQARARRVSGERIYKEVNTITLNSVLRFSFASVECGSALSSAKCHLAFRSGVG